MMNATRLAGVSFTGHLKPLDASDCELSLFFGSPLADVPKETKMQRDKLSWQSEEVSCFSAVYNIASLGIVSEEVVISVDSSRTGGTMRLLMQSLTKPEFGIIQMELSSDGQTIEGGCEGWQPGQRPLISARRKESSNPTPSRPPPARVSSTVTPKAPTSPPIANCRRPSPVRRPNENSALNVETLSPAVSLSFQPMFRDGVHDEPRLPGPDTVIGGDCPGRSVSERTMADKDDRRSTGNRGNAGNFALRPDLLTGGQQQDVGGVAESKSDALQRLVSVASSGDVDEVKKLAATVELNQVCVESGLTPLIAAASRGRDDIVTLLLDWRADLEFSDPDRRTALVHAVFGQRLNTVRNLIATQAAVNSVAADRATPLSAAAARARTEICTALLEARAKVEAVDAEGRKPVHHAAKNGSGGSLVALINSRCRLEDKDSEGFTPLLLATRSGRAECVKTLLAQRANPGAQDLEGRTAAKMAALYEHDKILRILRDAGG